MGDSNSIATAGRGSLDGLARRLGALEESLTVVAGELGVAGMPQQKLAELQDSNQTIAVMAQRLTALELRIEKLSNAMASRQQPQNLSDAIAAEVSRQIAAMREAAAQALPAAPLLSDAPINKALEHNPLVMSAAERAIVRLSHRLEKLEQSRSEQGDGDKSSSRRKSRWFES